MIWMKSPYCSDKQFRCGQCDNYPALRLTGEIDEKGPLCQRCWIGVIQVEFHKQFYNNSPFKMVEDTKCEYYS